MHRDADDGAFPMRDPPDAPGFDASHPDYWDWSEYNRYIQVAPWLRSVVAFHRYRDKRLLEVGCGTGVDLFSFARRGASVVGMDIAPTPLHLTRQRFRVGRQTGSLIMGDAASLPLRDQIFDGVYLCDVLAHTAQKDDMLREIHRVLKPGCTALIIESAGLSESWPPPVVPDIDVEGQRDVETTPVPMPLVKAGTTHQERAGKVERWVRRYLFGGIYWLWSRIAVMGAWVRGHYAPVWWPKAKPKRSKQVVASQRSNRRPQPVDTAPMRPYRGRLAPWFYHLWYHVVVTWPEAFMRVMPAPLQVTARQRLSRLRQPVAAMFTHLEGRLGRGLIPKGLKVFLRALMDLTRQGLRRQGAALLAFAVQCSAMLLALVARLGTALRALAAKLGHAILVGAGKLDASMMSFAAKLGMVKMVLVAKLGQRLRPLRRLQAYVDRFRPDQPLRSHLMNEIGFQGVRIVKYGDAVILRVTRGPEKS